MFLSFPHCSSATSRHLRSGILVPVALAALIGLWAHPALAQSPQPNPPGTPEFMSRYNFDMSAASLASGSQQFSFDTRWNGDLDVVDYVYGRLSAVVDYQAILGNEFRSFDPNQSTYTLEVASSVRDRGTELAVVFNHVSRHLGDRPKILSISENSIGPRVLRRFGDSGPTMDLRAEFRKVINPAYVDYKWIGQVDVTVRRTLSARTGVYGRGFGEMYGVDAAVAGRERQQGGRAEIGLRLTGTHGNVDLFAGAERVVDADPLDRLTRHWAFAGFRLASK